MRPPALQLTALAACGVLAAGFLAACGSSPNSEIAPTAPEGARAELAGRVHFQGAPVEGIRLRFVPDPSPRPMDDTLTARADAVIDRTDARGEFSHPIGRSGGITLQVMGAPDGCTVPAAARHELAAGERRFVELTLACSKAPKGGTPVE